MKKTSLLKGLLVSLMLLCSAHIWAWSGWSYSISAKNEDGVEIRYDIVNSDDLTVEVVDTYLTYDGLITIPDEVIHNGETYSVIGIAALAFQGASNELTEVTISRNITYIGNHAFYLCDNLETVNFNAIECTSTGDTSHLSFRSMTNISKVNFGNEVTIIPEYLFYGCSGISGPLEIPNSVKTIGNMAFYNCTGLTSLTLGEGVTTIENSAFSGCSGLMGELNLPDSLTYIGDYVFSNCSGFTGELRIPNGVTYLSGFGGCTGLTGKLVIPNSVTTIGSYAFYRCTGLTSLTLGNSVTSIGNYAFYDCSGLTGELSISSNVTSIGNYAFSGCTAIEKVTLEDGDEDLTAYGYAFHNCPSIKTLFVGRNLTYNYTTFVNLTSVNLLIIGEKVTRVSSDAYSGCDNINVKILAVEPPETSTMSWTKIEVPKQSLLKYATSSYWNMSFEIFAIENEETYYPAPIYYEGDALITSQGGDVDGAIIKKGDMITVTPVGGKEQINGNIIHGTEDLTEIFRTNGTYSITVSNYFKDNIFQTYYISDENNFDITLSESGQLIDIITVNKINDVYYLKVTGDINGADVSTIRRMPNLVILDLSEANVVSGGGAYYESYTTSNNVIGSYFFYDKSNLKFVTLPQTATSIDTYAFSGCSGLTGIAIPNRVTSVGSYAFQNCTNLVDLTLKEGTGILEFTTSSSSTFSSCPLQTLCIGRNISFDSSVSPFQNKEKLTSLTFSDDVTSINSYQFYGCSGFATLDIPNSITEIGKYAFYGCSNLSAINIPNGVNTIESYTFYGCESLSEISIPNNVVSIGDYAFYQCLNLNNFTVEDGTQTLKFVYTTVDGKSTQHTFTNCPINTLYLGRNWSGLTPFDGITTLTTLVIGNYVTEIGSYEFDSCSGLTSLTLGNSVESISYGAFCACGLLEVEIPNSVTSIGEDAFFNCSKLEKARIGKCVKSIGSSAFRKCSSLMELTSLNPTPPNISSSTFDGVDKEACVLNVPIGSLNAYWVHVYWGEFFNINEVDGIDNVLVDNDNVQIKGIDGAIVVSGDNVPIYVYTINGMLIHHDIVQGEKSISLPQGNIYIVKAGTQTMKVKM